MKTSSEEAELFYADGHKDRHDDADCRSSQFCELTKKRNFCWHISPQFTGCCIRSSVFSPLWCEMFS